MILFAPKFSAQLVLV